MCVCTVNFALTSGTWSFMWSSPSSLRSLHYTAHSSWWYEQRSLKIRILTSNFVCGMQYAVCVTWQKIEPMVIVWAWVLTYTADFRFAIAHGMWCEKMNRNMSWFMQHASANSDGKIQQLMSQVGVSMNFDDTRDSQQVCSDVDSAYTPFNTPWYAPCSSRLFKMLWTHQPHFLFFNFFPHIKWYAIAMIIEPLCSISSGKRCNTGWQGGMLWLGGPCQKDWKSRSMLYIRILPCRILHAANCKMHVACVFCMSHVRSPSFS